MAKSTTRQRRTPSTDVVQTTAKYYAGSGVPVNRKSMDCSSTCSGDLPEVSSQRRRDTNGQTQSTDAYYAEGKRPRRFNIVSPTAALQRMLQAGAPLLVTNKHELRRLGTTLTRYARRGDTRVDIDVSPELVDELTQMLRGLVSRKAISDTFAVQVRRLDQPVVESDEPVLPVKAVGAPKAAAKKPAKITSATPPSPPVTPSAKKVSNRPVVDDGL